MLQVLQQEGRKSPTLEKLKPDHWEHILALPTKSARRRYYQFLWKNEMHAEAKDIRRERKKVDNEIRLTELRENEAANEHISYGLLRNTMFLRIYDSTITEWNNRKLIRAMMFEQKLIIDCSYDEYMNKMEASNAAKQLMYCFAENRLHDEPFDLHFCNVDLNSIAGKTLHKGIPTLLDRDFPLSIHKESLTEIFDKKKLVYLTPHCNNELEKFNHDDIYIIGGMVDKQNNDPLSLAKAKKQGLRMAKLPLDKYLEWGAGSGKSLTLNQMVKILLEMKKTGDWNKALRFVPRRKIIDYNQSPSYENRRPFVRTRSYQQRQQSYQSGDFLSVESMQFNNDRTRTYQPRQNYRDENNFAQRRNSNENSRNYQSPRQSHGNQQEFSSENRLNNTDQPRLYQQRSSFNEQKDSSCDPRQFHYDRSRTFQQRQQQGNHQTFSSDRQQPRTKTSFQQREDFVDDMEKSSVHRSSNDSKERKHFEKFKFNLDSWGTKTNSRKKDD